MALKSARSCHSFATLSSQQNVAEKVQHGKPKKGICNQIESGPHLIEESRTGTGTVLKVNSCGQEQTGKTWALYARRKLQRQRTRQSKVDEERTLN